MLKIKNVGKVPLENVQFGILTVQLENAEKKPTWLTNTVAPIGFMRVGLERSLATPCPKIDPQGAKDKSWPFLFTVVAVVGTYSILDESQIFLDHQIYYRNEKEEWVFNSTFPEHPELSAAIAAELGTQITNLTNYLTQTTIPRLKANNKF